jgi:hypothetical protein
VQRSYLEENFITPAVTRDDESTRRDLHETSSDVMELYKYAEPKTTVRKP